MNVSHFETIMELMINFTKHIANLPILYSFRRCPYAMRTRLSLVSSKVNVELREVVLREKPYDFLRVSPSATVPCLVIDNKVIDESLDIMIWALNKNDPENWLDMPCEGYDLIKESDGPFKNALDEIKYASRHPDIDLNESRKVACRFLFKLETMLTESYLFGENSTLADFSILPFIRQFANVDITWFNKQPWPKLQHWLNHFITSNRFQQIQSKYPQWKVNDNITIFPES